MQLAQESNAPNKEELLKLLRKAEAWQRRRHAALLSWDAREPASAGAASGTDQPPPINNSGTASAPIKPRKGGKRKTKHNKRKRNNTRKNFRK